MILLCCPKCGTQNRPKRYVGSTDTYYSCSKCFETYGGEETAAKKALISAAVSAQISEENEVDGIV